jgi:predicted RNase H-like HicB family nuclease
VQAIIDGNSPQVKFRLPVKFKDEGAWTVALCEPLGIASQGRDRESARSAIIEAVSLFLETAFEMGNLDAILREQGFTKMQSQREPLSHDVDMIDVPMELVVNAQAKANPLRSSC